MSRRAACRGHRRAWRGCRRRRSRRRRRRARAGRRPGSSSNAAGSARPRCRGRIRGTAGTARPGTRSAPRRARVRARPGSAPGAECLRLGGGAAGIALVAFLGSLGALLPGHAARPRRDLVRLVVHVVIVVPVLLVLERWRSGWHIVNQIAIVLRVARDRRRAGADRRAGPRRRLGGERSAGAERRRRRSGGRSRGDWGRGGRLGRARLRCSPPLALEPRGLAFLGGALAVSHERPPNHERRASSRADAPRRASPRSLVLRSARRAAS